MSTAGGGVPLPLYGQVRATRASPLAPTSLQRQRRNLCCCGRPPEEALAEAVERRGCLEDAGSDDDDGGIDGTEHPVVFRVSVNPGAMRVVVPLPEKFI